MKKTITIKDEHCDWEDNGLLACGDYEVYCAYFKNGHWNLYCTGDLKSQKDADHYIEEITEEYGVDKKDIKFLKPLSSDFVETTISEILKKKARKQGAALKKRIAAFEAKYGDLK